MVCLCCVRVNSETGWGFFACVLTRNEIFTETFSYTAKTASSVTD